MIHRVTALINIAEVKVYKGSISFDVSTDDMFIIDHTTSYHPKVTDYSGHNIQFLLKDSNVIPYPMRMERLIKTVAYPIRPIESLNGPIIGQTPLGIQEWYINGEKFVHTPAITRMSNIDTERVGTETPSPRRSNGLSASRPTNQIFPDILLGIESLTN